jgi:hypothetical protein
MTHERLRLGDAHALDRNRHHDAREARAGLPHLQGLHRLAGTAQVIRELRQPGLQARLRRVDPELGPERRIGQQPLDQRPGANALLILSG